MKKLLLSLAAAAIIAPAALADTAELSSKDATNFVGTYNEETTSGKNTTAANYQPLESCTIGNFSFAFTSTNETANLKPAYFYPTKAAEESGKGVWTLRAYAGTTMTLSAPEGCTIQSIEFKGSNAKKMDEMTVNTGAISVSGATASNFSWSGDAEAISFTFAGTYRITSMTITYTAGGDVKPQAEAPVFNPASCSFTSPLSVEITAAQGAQIYYTLDGTNPTTDSDLYEAPIAVTETTTIKAMAVQADHSNSAVASATYTKEVAYTTLKDMMEAGLADTNTAVKFSGEAVVAYQYNQYLFVQDASASMLIYGNLKERTYQPGDVITGFAGQMTTYSNLNELTKLQLDTFGDPVKTVEAPKPVLVDIEEVTPEMQNQYVVVQQVKLTAVTEGDKTTYKLVDPKDADLIAYPRFPDSVTFPTADTDNEYTVEGFLSVYKNDLQIYPTKFDLYTGVSEIEAGEQGEATFYNFQGQRVANPAQGQMLIKVQGGKASKVIF